MSKSAVMTDPREKDLELRANAAAQDVLERHQDLPGRHEIATLAHQRWIERGRPEGSPEVDWFQAEEELGLRPNRAKGQF